MTHWLRRPRNLALLLVALGCSTTAGPVIPDMPGTRPAPPPAPAPAASRPPAAAPASRPGTAAGRPARDSRPAQPLADGRLVRVLVRTEEGAVRFSANAEWEISAPGEFEPVAAGLPGREWQVQRQGRQLRVVRPDGVGTLLLRGPLTLTMRAADVDPLVTVGGKRYRGELTFHASDSGTLVVNRLPLEEYLKGVVPAEIGRGRTWSELAAAEAQAVAARSYALTRLGSAAAPYDLRPTVLDQVYGGADAETAVATRAVENTRGLALHYRGRVVNAPYHAACGGETAEAPEVWRTRGEPYLQRVSDRIPGTDRDYCAIAPRYRWTARLRAQALDAAVARYLRAYAPSPVGGPGPVRAVRVTARTASGRVGAVAIDAARGSYTVRGNDVRYVLRPGGEILNSTYFSVRDAPDGDGIVLEGRGHGHGVGMCQWGAIGRAREGQDFRMILRTYFPGTTVERAY